MLNHIRLSRFASDQRGATAIEYGLIAAMIALVVVSIGAAGGAVDGIYDTFTLISVALGI